LSARRSAASLSIQPSTFPPTRFSNLSICAKNRVAAVPSPQRGLALDAASPKSGDQIPLNEHEHDSHRYRHDDGGRGNQSPVHVDPFEKVHDAHGKGLS